MTKRDFFIIVIRILGLYLLLATLFSSLPGFVFMAFEHFGPQEAAQALISSALIFIVFYFLIFKADVLVRLLKMDQGFDDERLEIGNFNSGSLLGAAVVVIGGMLFLNNLPRLLSDVLLVFQASMLNQELGRVGVYNWAVPAINMIIGYLLIANYRGVAFWLMKKDDNP